MALPHPPARRRGKMPERKKLDVGQLMASATNAYRVESILGSGGFGDVYKVVVIKDETKKYAMKTEYFDPRKRKLLNRLKVAFLKSPTEMEVEMGVFTEIQAAPAEHKKHFIQMVDKGQTELFKFIVMEIVSHSLEDIRKVMLGGKLSWQTAIKVASQTLIAVSDLHSIGYIHRDIKPHNFAIGRPPEHTQIYMLDFGIARRFSEKDGKIRVPRERVTFLGTVKFASRHCHMEREQSRRDDLEVWIYMALELFEQENLIWRRQTNRIQILQLKERIFANTDELDLRMPTGFKKIIEHVKKLNFADKPDYEMLNTQLWQCAKLEKLDMTIPLDWIDRVMPEKPKKKKAAAARLENDDDSADRRRRKQREERKKKEKQQKATQPGTDNKESKKKDDEDDDDEDDEEEDDKKESNDRVSEGKGGGGEGKVRKKDSRRKTTKQSKEQSKEGTVDVEPKKHGSDEKRRRHDDKQSKMSMMSPYKKQRGMDMSRKDRLSSKKMSSSTAKTYDHASNGVDKHSKKGSDRFHSAKDKDKKSDKKRKSDIEKQPMKEPQKPPMAPAKPVQVPIQSCPVPSMMGPPVKNVSMMVPLPPTDNDKFVQSGYIALEMGPKNGRK